MNLTKPRLDQFKITGSTVGDVYFPQTKLLLPFDGSNGATTTSDSSNSNHTVAFVGDAELSTAQSKFGGSSLKLDGTVDCVTLPASTCNFGTADFTVETWIYLNSAPSNASDILSSNYAGGAEYWLFRVTPARLVYFAPRYTAAITSSGAISLNNWHHIAFVRSSGTFTIYINGSADGSASYSYDFDGSGLSTLTKSIGGSIYSGWTANGVDGYMDDFRITKGLARYTSAFTPPTTAHLTSAGDVNKQIIVNSAADGVAIGTGGINQARIAKAWANINGTGTISIRGSYNVSSLTDEATGKYKVNFSTAMADNNYVGFCAGAEVNSGTTQNHLFHLKRGTPISDILNTAYIYVASANAAGTQTDDGLFCVIVFGN